MAVFEAIIAYDCDGQGWIMERSQDCIERDVLCDGSSTEDNNVEVVRDGKSWVPALKLLKVKLEPWSAYCSITEDTDEGVEAHVIEVLCDYSLTEKE